jgi:hypothetical protein
MGLGRAWGCERFARLVCFLWGARAGRIPACLADFKTALQGGRGGEGRQPGPASPVCGGLKGRFWGAPRGPRMAWWDRSHPGSALRPAAGGNALAGVWGRRGILAAGAAAMGPACARQRTSGARMGWRAAPRLPVAASKNRRKGTGGGEGAAPRRRKRCAHAAQKRLRPRPGRSAARAARPRRRGPGGATPPPVARARRCHGCRRSTRVEAPRRAAAFLGA